MERSEPTLVPGWLKSSGSASSGGGGSPTSHLFSHSDSSGWPTCARIKSTLKIGEQDVGHSSSSNRNTSSVFGRSPSSNGCGNLGSYSSSSRSHHNREKGTELPGLHGDHKLHEYFDPLEDIFSSRFEKERLRRSKSVVAGKHGEDFFPGNVKSVLNNLESGRINKCNGLPSGGMVISSVKKVAFGGKFLSKGAEEKQDFFEVERVSSPDLSTATQSVPADNSKVIGGPCRSAGPSVLTALPVIVGNSSTCIPSVQLTLPVDSAIVAPSGTAGLNMAETVAQVNSRARISGQVSVGTQRLEELAIIQSRRLVPVTPSLPKVLAPSPSDKLKPKSGQHPRTGPVKTDIARTSNVGKLHVLKQPRERNGITPITKDSRSPTNEAVSPSVNGSAAFLKRPGNGLDHVHKTVERKPASLLPTAQNKPSQAQSRNDFFNLMRKKSLVNPPAATDPPDSSLSSSGMENSDEIMSKRSVPNALEDGDAHLSAASCPRSRTGSESIGNGDGGSSSDAISKLCDSEKEHANGNTVPYPDEEEYYALLRSLGWDESDGEDDGLTEEEISGFLKKCMKLTPSSKVVGRILTKIPFSLFPHPELSITAASGPSLTDSISEF